ncbi:MAG: transporter substrate-binding domain-containing protein [Gammaproteobacteria bacterium]|nr:transporter substrate-binding domain-containing protein [Gammaproteobacteria bacterium]
MKWLLLMLSFFCLCPRLQAEPLVLVDSVAILKAAELGENSESLLLQHVLAHYPDTYQTQSLSRNRAREWIKNAGNACIPWLKKTAEREQHYLFSLPYMVEDALALVLLENSTWHPQLQSLQSEGAVSLRQLLQLPNGPLIGIEFNRSYGEQLDDLFVQQRHSRGLYTRTSSSEDMGSLLPMLERGFIDALLEYPKIAGRNRPDFRYYRLQDAEPVNLVYFACSKGEKGQAVVAGLNQAIQTVSQQPTYQALVLKGISPAQQVRALQFWLEQLR